MILLGVLLVIVYNINVSRCKVTKNTFKTLFFFVTLFRDSHLFLCLGFWAYSRSWQELRVRHLLMPEGKSAQQVLWYLDLCISKNFVL